MGNNSSNLNIIRIFAPRNLLIISSVVHFLELFCLIQGWLRTGISACRGGPEMATSDCAKTMQVKKLQSWHDSH